MTIFSSGFSLGNMAPTDIATYLTNIGDTAGAAHYQNFNVSGQSLVDFKKSWSHTSCILGYIPENDGSADSKSKIVGTSKVPGDEALIGTRIKISLDKFFIDSYPGFGQHTVLCEFSGKNQVAGESEELRLALKFESNDQASAGISGAPIFMGVTVGKDGISFEGRTINVKSHMDDVILATLDSPAFKSGLALLTTAQPALKPFASLATAAVANTLKRNENKQVHSFNIGLDFGAGVSSARLRLGSYVVVQTDDVTGWNWNNYVWNLDTHMIEHFADPSEPVTFNFMVFGVSRFSPATP